MIYLLCLLSWDFNKSVEGGRIEDFFWRGRLDRKGGLNFWREVQPFRVCICNLFRGSNLTYYLRTD